MKNLRTLTAVVALTLAIGTTAWAGEMSCPPPDPGEMLTPPCSTAPITPDDPFVPGEVSTPPAATADDVITISETAMGVLLSVLPLF